MFEEQYYKLLNAKRPLRRLVVLLANEKGDEGITVSEDARTQTETLVDGALT